MFTSNVGTDIRWTLLTGRLSLLAILLVGGPQIGRSDDAQFNEQIRPILARYCFDCHDDKSKQGSLSLDQFASTSDAAKESGIWWKVLRNLRSGVMPPAGESRPTPEETELLARWIKFRVFGIDPNDVDPGRIGVRRLNRIEYDNTVDDLMGIKFDASLVLPADDSGYGFDNVGDALSFSPLHMEKYLRAAQAIVDQAVPKVTWITPLLEIPGREFRDDQKKVNGNSLSSKTAVTVKHVAQVAEAGTYDILVTVRLHGSFDFDPSRYKIVFRIDGQEKETHEYGWDENKPFRYRFAQDWQAGDHEFAFELTPVVAPNERDAQEKTGIGRESTFARFEVQSVRVEGPQGTKNLVHPARYARFFPREEPPAANDERTAYAAEILRSFATRAFRGRVDQTTVDRLVTIAQAVYQQPGKTFEAGIAHAMVATLASPRFLFRLESASSVSPASAYPQTTGARFPLIDEYSLASRLSYFLWSTMPDETLFQLAEKGELRNQLPQQLKRMLADDRATEFTRNFVGQWLRTRDVTQVSVDPIVILGHQEEFEKLRETFRNRRRQPLSRELSPEDEQIRKRFGQFREISDRFNDDMKRAMRRETEMCFEYIVKDDHSLLDLLDCDYTFVNERLAGLYGIPDVRGNEFRRVTLPDGSPRGGVLTQASMLLVTSNPTRTSPVKRGLFILDNILGTPAPPAPGGVPDLEESAKKFAGKDPPLRELLAAHRESALCASCHSRMDPLGIALENFNALGMWRDQEKDQPIDASGKLITGEEFHDIRDLKKILRARHATDFYRCVTEKMLTYALGRGLSETDEQTIDVIVSRLVENDGKFSALMQGVVESAPFQKQNRTPVATLNPQTP